MGTVQELELNSGETEIHFTIYGKPFLLFVNLTLAPRASFIRMYLSFMVEVCRG
jgi:hypothetical protein